MLRIAQNGKLQFFGNSLKLQSHLKNNIGNNKNNSSEETLHENF